MASIKLCYKRCKPTDIAVVLIMKTEMMTRTNGNFSFRQLLESAHFYLQLHIPISKSEANLPQIGNL